MAEQDDIALTVTKAIIKDVHNRYPLEMCFRSIHPKMQVAIYEAWRKLVAKELHKRGMINESYEPINTENMSLYEAIKRHDFYKDIP